MRDAKHTLLATFGTAGQNAMSATVCDNAEIALREAARIFTADHFAPVFMVTIKPGDHAPRIVSSVWTWPNSEGWPA
jgi:hypothetical protein